MHPTFLFDLDQTLLDFHASERKALEIISNKYGLNYSEESYLHFMEYNKSLWLELEKGIISRSELFKKRFEDFLNRFDKNSLNLDPLKINDDFILTMSQNGVLMDGALDFIKRLKNDVNDCRIYIVSNGAVVNANGRIKSTGLDEFLDGIFVSEAMGVTKPSAKFFEIVLKEIGEPKESCIVIGDSLSSDMAGAQNASLKSVWFIPHKSEIPDFESEIKKYEIDYCAETFDELYGILKKWGEDRIGRIF